MIAQVRPLRPEFAAESLRHLWGVVLPAAPPAPAVAGRERRRHHTGDPITRPVERATRLIPSARLLTVLTREQAAHDDGAVLPGLRRRLQPCSRGTAPEMFLALGRRHLPDVVECLEPLEGVIGRPEETLLCEAVWESMPRANFCADLLARVETLAVVTLPDAMAGTCTQPIAEALAS